ncbi:MAG: MarR family transcriptional regulator [Verrucomicrobiae bacterium]|nr:MarR family transcriptional regulator [Verrucomicrobiae bacterium]
METDISLLFHHLNRAHHLLQGLLQKEIDKHNLDGNVQAGMRPIFCALAEDHGMTVSELASQLRLAKSSVTGAVRRMEKSQLVSLVPDGNDGRRRRVVLTAKGRELVPVCAMIEKTLGDQLNRRLTKAEFAELLRLLTKLTDGSGAVPAN